MVSGFTIQARSLVWFFQQFQDFELRGTQFLILTIRLYMSHIDAIAPKNRASRLFVKEERKSRIAAISFSSD